MIELIICDDDAMSLNQTRQFLTDMMHQLKLNNKNDRDILAWIQKQKSSHSSSVQGAIKALIREDIARNSQDA